MRLDAFILGNIPAISAEWEDFAATLLPDEEFSRAVLRDGIEDLLHKTAADMKQPQTARQQHVKAEGDNSRASLDDTADTHASERIGMGVSSRQLISEFRALRASVIRLWRRDNPSADNQDIYDLTRFNEAIDQSLATAEEKYTEVTAKSREMFLGILGHDLRNPLAAISGSAEAMLRATDLDRSAILGSRILVSTGRMSQMITDLIELTRVQLGKGISVSPTRASLKETCLPVMAEMEVIHPNQRFSLIAEDDVHGSFDTAKMKQVLSNLIGNAVQHGASNSAVTVTAQRTQSGLELHVHNDGPAIPPAMLPKIFDCFVQAKSGLKPDEEQSTSLGLGLYIAKEIVAAHGGTIDVQSSDGEGTTFIVRLPELARTR